jgi:chloramphenicol-sensitive protein RarD
MLSHSDRDVKGWLNALVAFGWWGFVFPSLLLLLKSVTDASVNSTMRWSLEILLFRILYCLLFCLGVLIVVKRIPDLLAVFRSRVQMFWFAISAMLIFLNWTGFVYGATSGRLSQTSLGYYMGPLINIALGYLFLSEKLSRTQLFSVILAALGVLWLTFIQGEFPWIAMVLAISFSFYGLVRKRLSVDSIVGMTVESFYCLPVAIGCFIYFFLHDDGVHALEAGWKVNLLLVLVGPATAIPLISFAIAARRLRLGTLGFIQFIAPTGQLLLAMFVDGETIPAKKFIGYLFVWVAVVLYLVDLWRTAPVDEQIATNAATAAENQ